MSQSKSRKSKSSSIPSIMATQHPDNSCAPYWGNQPFVSTADEVQECYHMFNDLNFDEYMWDWEGKFVDEAVVDRLFNKYFDFFKKRPLGLGSRLTFRIPNIWQEKGVRLARAFITIITAAQTAAEVGFHVPPIFEVILPMTTSADQLITIIKKFKHAVSYEKDLFGREVMRSNQLEMIPLIEGSATLLESRAILKKYVTAYKKIRGHNPKYLRTFIARSDPALDAGFVPAVLSARGALSEYYRFSKDEKIPVYPIIGVGGFNFRGGLNPSQLDRFIKLYAGVRTVTLQSAFRYDYPKAVVKKSIQTLKKQLPRTKATIYSDEQIKKIMQLTEMFAGQYRPIILSIAPLINNLAKFIPSHRERIPHSGHFGYSRHVGKAKVNLPRAITFTSVFMSLGIPPTFIGTGLGIQRAIEKGFEKDLFQFFPGLKNDLVHDGYYLNWENLKFLSQQYEGFKKIRQEIKFLEDYFGLRFGPKNPDHFIHRNLTSNIYHYFIQGSSEGLKEEIIHAARVRHGLG